MAGAELTWILVGAGALAVLVAALVWMWRRGAARRRGQAGEKLVRKQLGKLRKKEFRVFNDIWLGAGQGRSVQIDHLVVSTRGIFVIETKALQGHIKGNEHGQYWEQKFLMSARSFYNPLLQNVSHVNVLRSGLKKVLRQADLKEEAAELPEGWADDWAVSIVVFTAAWRVDVQADDIVERGMFGERRRRRTLDPARSVKRRWWRRGKGVELDEGKMVMLLPQLRGELNRRARVMTRDEMDLLVEGVERLLEAGAEAPVSRRAHVAQVKQTAKEKREQIARGVCPRCGAALVLRQGDYGPFYGCSRYPACRFICSAAPDR